ncbi:hypothetical protein IFM89_000985 [Coptis chinensis]|uniref:Uncharacterized protein n=1 Tax=Coptis chinensis TaxID=261450 RepID=A0A835IG73_9MAGN|nr:hypothetical protein IFM89_000985 [Coptis chinensis]
MPGPLMASSACSRKRYRGAYPSISVLKFRGILCGAYLCNRAIITHTFKKKTEKQKQNKKQKTQLTIIASFSYSFQMLAKKVESTVTKAMDVETKKMGLEVAATEKKVASIRVEKDDEKRAK